jgi:hypothetical protein
MKYLNGTKGILSFALLLASSSISSASVMISYGNTPQEGNIVFNGTGTSITDPVVGRVNNTNYLYNFTSSELLQAEAQGQAKVAAQDGSFADLTFFSPGNYFMGAVFNLNVYDPKGPAKPIDGTVQFTLGLLGEPDYVSGLFNVSANGNNFFTFATIDDEKITSIRLVTSTQLADIRQVRISDTTPIPNGEVPEPTSLFLIGSGTIFLAYFARSRRKPANHQPV